MNLTPYLSLKAAVVAHDVGIDPDSHVSLQLLVPEMLARLLLVHHLHGQHLARQVRLHQIHLHR